MLNDYVIVGSAKVIDLGFEVDLLLEASFNQGDIVTTVITTISEYFDVSKMEMGLDLNMGQLKGDIMRVPGVLNIIDLKVFNKVGGNYSQAITSQPYIDLSTRQIGLIDDTIYAKPDEILQIKFPEKDIAIRVKK